MPDNPINPRRLRDNAEEFRIMGDFVFIGQEINQQRPINPERVPIRKAGRGQILDTVGIELESIGLPQNTVSNILRKLPEGLGEFFAVHRDGSSEIKIYSIEVVNRKKTITISSHTKTAEKLFARNARLITQGYELVSVPMTIDTAELALRTLIPNLEASGDFISNRCASHIHVGMGKNLQMLKNTLKFGLWADELFYSLSGMGGKFRGNSNNAIYARPLMNGPYFECGKEYFQILNIQGALNSGSVDEFFTAYGVDSTRDAQKYHPARYFSINLYSILLHGTLEFRHFNQCFDHKLIIAITKLCQLFCEISIKGNNRVFKYMQPGNVFELKTSSYYIDKLHELLYIGKSQYCNYELETHDIYQLEKIIMNYDGIGIPDIPVMSHLKEVNISWDTILAGKLLKAKSRPAPPGNTDIHNIKYKTIMDG